jgi:cell division control protein 6
MTEKKENPSSCPPEAIDNDNTKGDELIKSELFGSNKIFVDESVLSLDYIPQELLRRDKQIQFVATQLSPAARGHKPHNFVLYGVRGCGKTVVVRYVLKKLQLEETAKPVYVAYVNCAHIRAETHILRNIIVSIDAHTKVPKCGISTGYYYDALYELVNQLGCILIVVLDEIDQINGDQLLYNLSRAGENGYIADNHISVIGITNHLQFGDSLSLSVKSSFGRISQVFSPYSFSDLSDILRSRADLAFRKGVLDDEVIPFCATLSATLDGDARKAIELMRTAGVMAVETDSDNITDEHVKLAKDRLEGDKVVDMILSLPRQQQVMLYAIYSFIFKHKKKRKATTTGDVYNEYLRQYDNFGFGLEPLPRSLFGDYVSKFGEMGFVETIKVHRGRYGLTREISTLIPLNEVLKIFKAEFEN